MLRNTTYGHFVENVPVSGSIFRNRFDKMTTATQHRIKDMTRDQLLELVEDMANSGNAKYPDDSMAAMMNAPAADAREIGTKIIGGKVPLLFWVFASPLIILLLMVVYIAITGTNPV